MPAVEHSFPDPIVFAPVSGVHKHTVILLHGRGGSAETFSQRLLHMPLQGIQADSEVSVQEEAALPAHLPTATATTFFEALPDTKFIFPCARRQRATVYKRSIVRQWFDDWHLDPALSSDVVDSRYDDGLQITGLGESVEHLHGLIAEEVKLVGSGSNVVIGGFSQGAATSLITAILWDGSEALGGVVAMSGWLPYMKQMADIFEHPGDLAKDKRSADIDNEVDFLVSLDPFEQPAVQEPTGHHTGSCQTTGEGALHTVLDWLREEIELPAVRQSHFGPSDRCKTIAMLCHGSLDKQVEHLQGEQACLILPKFGVYPVLWKLYDNIQHDYSAAILSEIMQFLKKNFP